MPPLPQLQPILAAVAAAPLHLLQELPVAQRRELIHAAMTPDDTITQPAPASVAIRDIDLTVHGPVPGSVRLRVYTPPCGSPEQGFPANLFMHGGAWWMGTVEQTDAACGNLAALADCVVVSLDYRLAPEFPYPAALEDTVAAWQWLHANAADLGVESARMSIGGESAGGNLAASACLLLRDRGLPMPVAQVLTVPAPDYPSVDVYAHGYILERSMLEEAIGLYLGDHGDAADPYASPIRAASLAGLPPALVLTCEYDPVRDVGEAYARRLAEAGVDVQQHRADGLIHSSCGFTALLEEARQIRAMTVDFLIDRHGA